MAKKFKNEAEEVAYWEKQEAQGRLSEEHGWQATGEQLKVRRAKPISLRLPESLIESFKIEARSMGIGYQTLMRIRLMESVHPRPHVAGRPMPTRTAPASGRVARRKKA